MTRKRIRRPFRIAFGSLAILIVLGGVWAWYQRPLGPLDRARIAYAEGRYREALDLANALLRTQPDDRDALRISARSSARLGRDEATMNLFLRLGSTGAEAEDFFLLASALARNGKSSEAERFLRDALRVEPAHPESLDRLAGLLKDSDRLSEAREFASSLQQVKGWEARGAARLGLILEAQGDYVAAARAFQDCLDRDPAQLDEDVRPEFLRKRLARALLRLGRPDEAEARLHSLTSKSNEDDPEVDWLLSRVALQRRDREAALAAWKTAAAETPAGEPAAHAQEEPAPFVGAQRCAPCHPDVYDDQQKSRHALTFHRGGDVDRLGLAREKLADPGDPDVTLEVSAAELQARVGDDLARALVDYVLGSGRHAMTPIGRDQKGLWREFRLTRYAEIEGWDVTPGHPARVRSTHPDDHLGERQTPDSLRRCLGCHTTNAHAVLDDSRESPETADHGIGCERCHGPGGNHVASAELKFMDPALTRFRPGRSGVRAGVMRICGDCHGTEGRQLPGADPAATVRFQGTTLTWSRCFIESRGGFDCLSCHDAHRSADEPLSAYDAKCLACHDSEAAKVDSAPRTACPVNPRTDCVSCHMPKTRSIVPHAMFTDHHIRIHPESKSGFKGR